MHGIKKIHSIYLAIVIMKCNTHATSTLDFIECSSTAGYRLSQTPSKYTPYEALREEWDGF
jgi:hypothetical protein